MSTSQTRWLDEREARAWRSFVQAESRLGATLQRKLQAECGMSMPDYGVLVHLSEAEAEGGRMRAFALGEAVQWEKSRLSHHLSRMERRGLIERQECPTDGRGAFIVITPAGRTAIEAAAPAHVAHVRRYLVDVLTPEQLEALGVISDAILQGLRADPSACDEAAN